MKKKRHELILRLITENAVTTQDELLELLKKNGYNVTQATVSRDIKELKLIKTPVKNGRSKYSVGSSGSDETPSSDGYIWPSDCRLITSGYGGRDQPTPGASTNHMGVDIGASYGSYIYAVKSGTVVGSKYSWGGYGNYVEIDHGNGNFT